MRSDQAILTAQTASRFATRPSSLLGIDDPYLAYCLDESLYLRLRAHEAQSGESGDEVTRAWRDLEGEGGRPPADNVLDLLPLIDARND